MNRAAFILLAVILPAAIHSYLIYQQQNKPVPKPEPMGVCYLIWQEPNGETRRVSASDIKLIRNTWSNPGRPPNSVEMCK